MSLVLGKQSLESLIDHKASPILMRQNLVFLLAAFTVVLAGFSIQTSFAEEQVSVEIISIEPIRADQWTISWDACSLVEKLGQDFKITTDLEWESFHIDFILYQDQCISDIRGQPLISINSGPDDAVGLYTANFKSVHRPLKKIPCQMKTD